MCVGELCARMTSREVGEWRALELLAAEDSHRARMDADAAAGIDEIKAGRLARRPRGRRLRRR